MFNSFLRQAAKDRNATVEQILAVLEREGAVAETKKALLELATYLQNLAPTEDKLLAFSKAAKKQRLSSETKKRMMTAINDCFSASQTWGCQLTASVSLEWDGGAWRPVTHNLSKPFLLVSTGDVLTSESVAPLLDSNPAFVSCRKDQGLTGQYEYTFCSTPIGATLSFNATTGSGGISFIAGAMYDGKSKNDPIRVSTFNCQKY